MLPQDNRLVEGSNLAAELNQIAEANFGRQRTSTAPPHSEPGDAEKMARQSADQRSHHESDKGHSNRRSRSISRMTVEPGALKAAAKLMRELKKASKEHKREVMQFRNKLKQTTIVIERVPRKTAAQKRS